MAFSMLAGAACAAGASAFYNGGIALQSLDAREEAAGESSGQLLAQLVRRRRWLLGTALTVLGWPLQAIALLLAPLAVVQPTLGVGLVLLVAVSRRRLGVEVGRLERVAVVGLLAGVGLAAAGAPDGVRGHVDTISVAVAMASLGGMTAAAALLRGVDGRTLAVAAGCGFAASGLATDLTAISFDHRRWVAVMGWAAATGALSLAALGNEMGALRLRAVTRVAPVVFAIQVIVPVALAPVTVNEHGYGVGVWIGTAVVAGAAAVLLGSPTVSVLSE